MSRRRRLLHVVAVALTTTLLTGCVEAPFDESQLDETEDVGVAAAPLNGRQARRAAQKARQAKATHGQQRARQQRRGPRGDGRSTEAVEDGTAPQQDADGDGGSSQTRPVAPRNGGAATPESPAPRPPAARYAVVAKAADASGDATGQAPAYADIRELLIESDGATARVTVGMAGRLPRALADGEVQGIGIDFYRSDERESDYQLFVDGGSSGWQAYLHAPDGVLTYPGDFSIGGRVLVFELPWRSLGGARRARVNMFVDWSQKGTVLAAVGNDRAPDEGRLLVVPR